MASKRCHFREVQLQEPEFAAWLQQTKDDSKGCCELCRKLFDISNVGIGAIKSHMKSKQHNRIMEHKQSPYTQSITDFFVRTNTSESTNESGEQVSSTAAIPEQTSDVSTVPIASPSTFLIISEEMSHAKVFWVIKVITSRYSFSSCKDICCLFSKMFPDSQIAQSFSCGAPKCAYSACFGIYLYFHELLIEKICVIKYYTLSFDESLNQINQKKQMDMIVRFWDSKNKSVAERYFNSEFVGHATAADMLTHFRNGMVLHNPSSLVQISLYGPNVNWKFYHNLFQERKGEEFPDLLIIGSCSLHVVDASFEKGAKISGWNLGNTLCSLWQIFHDTLARREDFIQITGSDLFPIQFCQYRWVEDIKVAEQALKTWPHVYKYVKTVKSERRAPASVSFVSVASACNNTLIKVKLEFFVAVAKSLQEFLLKFQTEAPMTPFLALSLKDLLFGHHGSFLKKEVLDKVDTFKKSSTIDPADKKNQKNPKHVDIGFATRGTLKKVGSELFILSFKNDCIMCLSAIVIKLLERCPLKCFLVQSLVSAIPQKFVSDFAEAQIKFERLLQILLNRKWCSAEACSKILAQFKGFVLQMKQNLLAEFLSFNKNADRLDEFYWNYMKDAKHAKVWEIFRIIFTLSHGQAAVEIGFSVNIKLLVENLQEKTLLASCFVYSSVKSDANHFIELSFTTRLKRNVQAARMQYQLYLEEQRKLQSRSDKAKKRRAVEDKIREVDCKRKLFSKSIQAMTLEADKLATKVEVKHNFTLLAKSNAFRLKICESEKNKKKFCDQVRVFKKKLKFIE